MPITALHNRPMEVLPEWNISDDAGANVEAMRLCGLVDNANHEDVLAQVSQDFASLGALGVVGELFVAVPQWQLPIDHRLDVLDSTTKAKYGADHPKPYVYENLWVPGTQDGSYTNDTLGLLGPEYDGKPWTAHCRLALPNTASPGEPLLHHLGKPFDNKYAEKGQETQLEAIAKQKALFEADHPDANLNPLTARDVSFMALVRLVKGEPMPMGWGFMRDASLPRTTVVGGSYVGRVDSSDSRLRLGWGRGYAYPLIGVGVSVGLNPA